jgi:hypothetical protein
MHRIGRFSYICTKAIQKYYILVREARAISDGQELKGKERKKEQSCTRCCSPSQLLTHRRGSLMSVWLMILNDTLASNYMHTWRHSIVRNGF